MMAAYDIYVVIFLLLVLMALVLSVMDSGGRILGVFGGGDTEINKSVPARHAEFPWRKHTMPPFKEMFSRLQTVAKNPPKSWMSPPKALTQRLVALVTRTYPEDYDETDSLADHYAEPVRIKCKEKGHISPEQAWKQISNGAAIADPKSARESVYEISRGCNLFNASLAAFLFSGKWRNGAPVRSVLDCVAGWGDRLTAAFATGLTKYVSWDTNPELQPVYKRIAEECDGATATDTQWSVSCAPFEDAEVPMSEFDLAFASPPFYDQELYLGENTSTTVHKSEDEWYSGFYRPMLTKAASAVRPGGHVLLYIPRGRMLNESVTTLSALGLKRMGTIGFCQTVGGMINHKKIRETFVWQRT